MPRSSLAALPKRARADRASGYVADKSLFEPRVLSLAAPLFDAVGETAGALDVLGPGELLRARFDVEILHAIVLEEARDLSPALGHR